MTPRPLATRRLINNLVKLTSFCGAALGLLCLVAILYEILRQGLPALSMALVFNNPNLMQKEQGGVWNAIQGTAWMTLLATVIGVPIGTLAGVYLAEFSQGSRFSTVVRFLANILMGTPSIIIGIFVYGLIVLRVTGGYSGYAGAVALAIIMIPLVARTTEDMLRLVPDMLRESALALGANRWRTTVQIVFKAARTGMLTGILLAIARVSGETAPLLFTAFNFNFGFKGLSGPTPNLTVTIFNYATSGDQALIPQAWGASLLITVAVLCMTVFARYVLQPKRR